jgi:hypothetical protein
MPRAPATTSGARRRTTKESNMAQSSLLGIQRAPGPAPGRDTRALGPGDSSDSGADLAGAEALDRSDPAMPVDVAMNEDAEHTLLPPETLDGDSDSTGTGERRSAASDAGMREAADISVDRIIPAPGEGELDEDEDPDLAFVDALAADDDLGGDDDDAAEPEDADADVDAAPKPAQRSASKGAGRR